MNSLKGHCFVLIFNFPVENSFVVLVELVDNILKLLLISEEGVGSEFDVEDIGITGGLDESGAVKLFHVGEPLGFFDFSFH